MMDFPFRLQHPAGVAATRDEARFLVAFARSQDPTATSTITALSALGLVPEDSSPFTPFASPPSDTATRKQVNNTSDRIWTRTVDGRAANASNYHTSMTAAAAAGLRSISPVYSADIQGRREYFSPLADVVLLEFTRGDPQLSAKVAQVTSRLGLTEDEAKSKALVGLRYFRVSNPLETHSLEIIDRINQESVSVVRSARFVTMPMIVPTAYLPNDDLYEHQWNMERIKAGGNGHTAWNIHRGSAGIIIAVLDEGCDLTHPDLRYSSTGVNLGTMSGDGSPTGNHGTACAGIAAATINNPTGIAGLAGECRLLPIAFDAWTDQEVAAGIRYAADNGARIISMSFGWDLWDPAIIDPAIQYAFDRNLVMCAATHNHNGPITYPATHRLIIACGASGRDDNRKSPSSPDGEPGWGSNFGPEISVVAPGIQIPTTDIQGDSGYVGGDYTLAFNGTSSATPHVAGLAALLIAQDMTRSNVDVRTIIETTAEKVGSEPYSDDPGHPNGRWNQYMGYGRINAFAALTVNNGGPTTNGRHQSAAAMLEKLTHIEREISGLRTALLRLTGS